MTLPFYRVTNKIKKKIKYKTFRVSRKIGMKGYEFELRDTLLLYFKFHPRDSTLLFLAKLEDEFFF